MKFGVGALLACTAGVVAVGTATATAPKQEAKFNVRFDCAKVAPATLLTSLAGGFGGTYSLKAKTKVDDVQVNAQGSGGYSHCDYAQSTGWPTTPTAEGPGEVTVLYGTRALDFYKRDHAAAVEGVRCDNLKAQNPNVAPDPRRCGPVPVTGLGNQAYEAAGYIAVTRGKVFLQVALGSTPDANGQPVMVPADLLVSIAKSLLARLPAG
jgi:hypothetical protein